MIVLPREDGFLLVGQRDHAHLSAAIAAAWRQPSRFPVSIWQRFVLAVRCHDDGWMNEEREPTVDTDGRPCDFKRLPTEKHLDVWRQSVRRACAQDPYRGLLVAEHARWLYTTVTPSLQRAEEKPPPPTVPAALQEQIVNEFGELSQRLVGELSRGTPEEQRMAEPDRVEMARQLLSFFDALSLMLLGAIEFNGRTQPLPFGDRRASLEIRPEPPPLTVTPWPFSAPSLRLETTAWRLNESCFRDVAQLARSLQSAPITPLSWNLQPPSKGEVAELD